MATEESRRAGVDRPDYHRSQATVNSEWWPLPNEVMSTRLGQQWSVPLLPRKLDQLAPPGDHLAVDHIYQSCGSMVNECCQQTAQSITQTVPNEVDGSAEDPFHDPRVAGDRATIAITGVSTSIADMMACFQTVARWSPQRRMLSPLYSWYGCPSCTH